MGEVKTYISKLDNLIEGGLIRNSVILITGKTGTGKSSFCLSYICYGTNNNESGIYISTEQNEKDIREDARAVFGFNLEELERKKLLKLVCVRPKFPAQLTEIDESEILKVYIYDLVEQISELVKKTKARRVVLDSVSMLELFIKNKYLGRIAMMYLIENLRKMQVTTLLVGTIPEEKKGLSTLGILESLVDGIIKLDFVLIGGEFKRILMVRKMKRINHSTLIHPFEITKKGIKILKI